MLNVRPPERPAGTPGARSTSLLLAETVRILAATARRLGLAVPGFRSPPRLSGAPRTIRRHASGAATVAVVVRDRPWPAVAADLVEGVLVANRLTGREAHDAVRALGGAGADDDLQQPGGLILRRQLRPERCNAVTTVESWRILVTSASVDGVQVETDYADLCADRPEGDAIPGPSDWEVTVVTAEHVHLPPGVHSCASTPTTRTTSKVAALLRFSDGNRHLFRGDGDPIGLVAALGS